MVAYCSIICFYLQAQEVTDTPATTVDPEQVAIQFQNIAIAAIEARVVKANLPDDLLVTLFFVTFFAIYIYFNKFLYIFSKMDQIQLQPLKKDSIIVKQHLKQIILFGNIEFVQLFNLKVHLVQLRHLKLKQLAELHPHRKQLHKNLGFVRLI